MVELGIKGREETMVDETNVATNVGCGTVKVYASPMMISLMEKTATFSIEPYLEKGQSSVGIHVDVHHLASTPAGMKVYAESEVIAIDRRKITFSVKAYNERGTLIGEGTHDRFIIDIEKFIAKSQAK